MDNDRTTLNITGGTDVFGADGEKVGSVSGVEGDYLVVSKGFFFPTDYYIPTSAITTADDDGVYLNVTKDEALQPGLGYRAHDDAPTSVEAADRRLTGLRIDDPVPGRPRR